MNTRCIDCEKDLYFDDEVEAAPDRCPQCHTIKELRAALERARALAEEWAAKKYAGDLTTAVYHGCAEKLAAALGEGVRP